MQELFGLHVNPAMVTVLKQQQSYESIAPPCAPDHLACLRLCWRAYRANWRQCVVMYYRLDMWGGRGELVFCSIFSVFHKDMWESHTTVVSQLKIQALHVCLN